MHLHGFTHVDFIELGLSSSGANRIRNHLGLYGILSKVTEYSLSNSLNTYF
jgi:hypothetical protein